MHRQPNVCLDCTTLVAPPTNGGRTPKRCPPHAAERKRLQRIQQKRTARARSKPRSCIGCGGQLPAMRSRGNPRKWCSEACRVRATRTPAGDDVEAALLRTLRRDPCVYCGRPSEQLDHIVPRAQGGEDHWANLAAVCATCNQRKSARTLLNFLLARPHLEQLDTARTELAKLGC